MVEGDTLPPVVATLSWPASVAAVHPDLTDATWVKFRMEKQDGTVLIDDQPAIFVDRVLRIVQYNWLAGNLQGQYNAKFKLRFNNGDLLTVPTRNYLNITVEPS
jgi:hypothetical protein